MKRVLPGGLADQEGRFSLSAFFNPAALRKAKTGCSVCNRVKD